MNLKYLFLFALLFLYACGKSQVPDAINGQSAPSNITSKQAEIIFEQSKMFPNETQLSFALIKDGKVFFYGIKRVNDTIRSFTNHQLHFEIGSITKVFTSTLLASFVNEGKVTLNENINGFLPVTLKADVSITFKQLANHTSGLPRMPSNFQLSASLNPGNPYKNYTEEKLKEYLAGELALNQPPGEKNEYSNLGAGLLGYTLTQIASMDYEQLLQTRIFSPYNMRHTTSKRETILPSLVKGRSESGAEVTNWDLSALVAAGGILSTTEDLAKFAKAQFDPSNKELALTRMPTFTISDKMKIGLEWHLLTNANGGEWTWHNGGTGGYTSSMALDIQRKNGVVLLSNVSAFSRHMKKIDDLCFELMRTLEAE